MDNKHDAVYVRVSSKSQNIASQLPDLERWVEANGATVKWYEDKFTGKTLDRKGWNKLAEAIKQGKVRRIVCWRLDRLGRTAAGLTKLFDDLREKKVNLVSLRDGVDLSTAAGRLMANVLASVSAYETEVRSERQMAGIQAAKAKGKSWGGSKPGIRKKVTVDQLRAVQELRKQHTPILRIAKAVGLSRPTVYSLLADSLADFAPSSIAQNTELHAGN